VLLDWMLELSFALILCMLYKGIIISWFTRALKVVGKKF
jgi:hypothetical protein